MCNDNNNKEASLTRMVATLERGRARVQEMQFLIASIKMCFSPKAPSLGKEEISWRRMRRPSNSVNARSTVDMQSDVITATATVSFSSFLFSSSMDLDCF